MAQITAADFSSNSLSGTTTVLNGFANVTLQSVPYALEGDKTFVVALRRGSPSGEVLTRSLPITLNDNSEFVSFTANVSSISEGNLISYTLVTANAIDGAKIYYSLAGAVNSNTYLEGAGFDYMYRVSPNFDAGGGTTFANNTVIVSNPTTKFINDIENITPGGRIYITNYNGELQHNYITIVSSGNVYTNDDVLYYRIISEEFIDPPVSSAVSGGNLYIEYVHTANLYYTANVDAGDFETGNTGFITINNNEGTITLRASNDLIYEQIENYNVQLRTNSIVGNIIYNSSGVSIEDTSYSVTYVSNSWNAAFYESGDTATFTLATLNEKNGRLYYYELEGNTNSSQFGLTSTGTFAVINNQGTLTTTIGSLPTGGTKNFRLVVKENDANGAVVARSDEIVLNPVLYMLATGGTMTYANSSIIHEFTTSGTFEVTQTASSVSKQTAQVFLVGGGGSSWGGSPGISGGGGGGGYHVSNVTLASTGVSTVFVAAGGTIRTDAISPAGQPAFNFHSTSPAPFAVGAGGDTYITGDSAFSSLRGRGGGTGSKLIPSTTNYIYGGVSGNVNNTATVFGPQYAATPTDWGAAGGGADGEAKFATRRFNPDTTYPYPGGTTSDFGMLYSDTYSDYGIYLPEPYTAGGKGVFSDISGKGRYYGGGGGAWYGLDNPAAPGVAIYGSRGGWGGGGRGGADVTYGNTALAGRQNSGGGAGGSAGYAPTGRAGGSGIAYIKYPFQGVRDLNNANNEGLLNSNLYPEVIYSVDNEIISFDYSNLLGPNQTLNYYTTGNVTSSMFIGGNTGSVVLPNTGNVETSSFTLQLNSSNIPTSGVLQFTVNLAFSGTDLAVSNTFLVTADTSITNATGGEITYADGYKIHTFKSSGVLTVNNIGSNATAEYLLVGGGGAGGGQSSGYHLVAGGAGAGGYIESSNTLALQSYSAIVGGGGAIGSRLNPTLGQQYLGDWLGSNYAGRDGGNTSFFGQTAYGGGGGGGQGSVIGNTAPGYQQYQDSPGYPGGSSGGNGIAGWNSAPLGDAPRTLGSSANIKLPIDSGQGFPGGVYATGGNLTAGGGGGGGGGGAGGAGANAILRASPAPGSYGQGGTGGIGRESFILGYPQWFSGGGGGAGGLYGRPGLGGGGAGYAYAESQPRGATGNVNTGGGGGGSNDGNGGGSGIIIIRYPFINI